MMLPGRPKVFSTLAMTALVATPFLARADERQFANIPATAVAVPDDVLADLRGKYVPPGDPRLAKAALDAQRPALSIGAPPSVAANGSVASPLAHAHGVGPVTYFGITMQSTWTVGTGAQAAGAAVGMTVGINPSSQTVMVNSWNSSTNGGVPELSQPPNGTVEGPGLSSVSNGVGQSIQVAGNGNTATNQTTVTYSPGSVTLTPVANLNTCGAQCTVTTANNLLGVAINTSRGLVSQSVGSGALTQSVQVVSDMNQITNQLGIQIQASPSNIPGGTSGLLTVLPTLIGIP